jgi:hypothetical protein
VEVVDPHDGKASRSAGRSTARTAKTRPVGPTLDGAAAPSSGLLVDVETVWLARRDDPGVTRERPAERGLDTVIARKRTRGSPETKPTSEMERPGRSREQTRDSRTSASDDDRQTARRLAQPALASNSSSPRTSSTAETAGHPKPSPVRCAASSRRQVRFDQRRFEVPVPALEALRRWASLRSSVAPDVRAALMFVPSVANVRLNRLVDSFWRSASSYR